MNVLVLNGSPKGEYSTTLYTCLYLEKHFPQHSFEYLNVAKDIKKYEDSFMMVRYKLEKADLIIFAYPVYTFLVPSQLHRFIELMKMSAPDLSKKYVTQITTSQHFYDMTAHRFIEENCQDMNMKFIKGLSADMEDLTTKEGREQARAFFKLVEYSIEHDLYEPIPPLKSSIKHRNVRTNGLTTMKKVKEEYISLVTDLDPADGQLLSMIKRFAAQVPYTVKLVNLRDINFQGGCIGCFNCAVDGTCIYKDGFAELLREQIQKSCAIVIAFSIKDHSMGSLFKTYDDRQFCNGHRTVTRGVPFAYLVSGDYSYETNLQTVIQARAEVGGNYLAGVATDEVDPDSEIDTIASRLCYLIENKYTQPSNFLGVGGMKIFRDLIWLMQGMMKADHKFYKENNQYDFPQKQYKKMLKMYLVGMLISNKKLKAKMNKKLNEGMIAPYKKVLKDWNN